MSNSQLVRQKRRRHARNRAKERIGTRLSNGQLSLLARRIQQQEHPQHRGKVRFVRRVSNSKTFWYVLHDTGVWLPVLYSSVGKIIVTILPLGSLGPVPER